MILRCANLLLRTLFGREASPPQLLGVGGSVLALLTADILPDRTAARP